MRTFDLGVDVSGCTDLPGDLHTAVTICLPEQLDGPSTVLFGFPGGGFGRHYYNIQARPGYSQADYHCASGGVFVACDHLGVGDSSQPDTFALTYENLAAANDATAETVIQGLRKGELVPGLEPIEITKTIGMGQSMGGCLLTVQQANHRTFDGVAFLGWSGIYTNFPAPGGERVIYPMPARGTDLRAVASEVLGVVAPTPEQFRYCFHWPDEEPALVEPDLASYVPYSEVVRGDENTPWGSATMPACAVTMMTEGSVAEEAAKIDVPVLSASGERDVVPDPWSEPTAYRNSRDVTVFVVPRMAHMHNFSHNRALLWSRIGAFAEATPART
jgi:pimeloyl-ACP methyl ester carboxylesterase